MFATSTANYSIWTLPVCHWPGHVTIDTLPDYVLLRIFHFVRVKYPSLGLDRLWRLSWRWHPLVHVCKRWRSVVFASPNFLDLRLVCGPRTRVELTGIWPPLPIIIMDVVDWPMPDEYDFAAIVHRTRLCEINLVHLTRSQLQRLASAMQQQFPALIHLVLDFDCYYRHSAPALSNEFLGGGAPRLQSLELRSIPFPTLPKLLLTATDLVYLGLWNIPHSGYISPEVIVTGLAALVNLKFLAIEFESPSSCPDRGRKLSPAPINAILPVLSRFQFRGASEYLEDLVTRVDTPLLDTIWITFFHQLIFDIPQLAQFMRRTTRFQALNEAHVDFDYYGVQVESLPPTRAFDEKSGLRILSKELDWQLSSLVQVFTSFFPFIYMVEQLYIYPLRYLPSPWQDDIERMQWLELFHPFSAVKNLYVSDKSAQFIAPALHELVGGRVIDVFPALECLFLEKRLPSGPVQEAIEQFVAARQLIGRPVAISRWNIVRGTS